MGAEFALAIRRAAEQHALRVVVPLPRSRKQPYCEPRAVQSSKLDQDTGFLKVSILPGLLGLDVAREIDAAVAELSSCDRLVLDLRGHLGGGLGVLRLMSYLTPGKIPIGFTLSRKRAELGYEKENCHGWTGYRLISRIRLASPPWHSGSGGAIRLSYSYQKAWDRRSGTAGLQSS